MPIYEYQCQQCQHRLEKLQRISDQPLRACPECGEDTLKKLVSAAAFRLKGSGWYETDFKKDGKRNLAADAARDDGTTSNKESGSEKTESPDSAPTTTKPKPCSTDSKQSSA